jgi:hypothetical protein
MFHLDAKTGKIIIRRGSEILSNQVVGASHPAHRLTAVTQRLVDMALGTKDNYLSRVVQNVAIV